ncbi:MBL fold metallo-hydrolase [Candidatus Viridilinea mediisalina]|uniref:MBL fold metallo-hydrolase n=1 Tax=Candidatus Viridilinea mediisalina TaxID=2024553 RepID=A0A2A6RPM1_9CHLR|nr:MBL fold metallo-hydrolase [Candidatus Viridilinea mediisalina]PDW04810.1 MBL fold metallo-hydrolase [Candidatus Viridilinea mediisalina]
MPRMILLGTGTGLPDIDRGNTHMLWDGPGGPLLIDAGGCTYERLLRAGIDPQGLRGVVLTHSHCDHIHGLPGLLFSMRLGRRTTPLPIYGLEETLEIARATLEAMRVEYYVPPDWRTLRGDDHLALDDAWGLRTALTAHSRPCVALRFEASPSGVALVYSADTEPCAAVQALATGAQILIHEATTPDAFAGHTSPRQAGEVALAAGVARLVLVHFSPRWTMPIEQAVAAMRSSGFKGQAEVGQDGQILQLEMD